MSGPLVLIPHPPMSAGLGVFRQVWEETRWSFTAPRHWLEGVFINLVLSVGWYLYSPLTSHRHLGWVILIGTYFATFILADVTTTNILGLDHQRVQATLASRTLDARTPDSATPDSGMPDPGLSLARVLLVKNLALLVIVGVPTLTATAILTLATGPARQLPTTLAGVALPVLAWLGVGNVASVLCAVPTVRLADRWRTIRDWRPNAVWAFHLAFPYALYYAVAPVDGAPRDILGKSARHMNVWLRAGIHVGIGALVWAIGTALACWIGRNGIHWRGEPKRAPTLELEVTAPAGRLGRTVTAPHS